MSKVNYINEVSVFYINVKTKLVEIFVTLQKILRELNHLNLKRRLVGLLWHCRKFLLKLNQLQCYKLLKLNKREINIWTYYRYIFQIYIEYIYNYYIAIASPLRCTWSNDGFIKYLWWFLKSALTLTYSSSYLEYFTFCD